MSTIWQTWCYRTSNNYLKENDISTILGHFYYSGNYLIGDFNVNLMNRNKMLMKKQYFESNNQTLPIAKKYIDLFFSHSLHQIFMKPTRITGHPKTLLENILKNCYWNGIIWSWTYLLFQINVTFETKRVLQNFFQVNEKLLRQNCCGQIKIDEMFWLLKPYLCERCLTLLICSRFWFTN